MAAGTGTPILLQLAEAFATLSLPLGGGLAAYAKWRKSAERDRRAREEAARIASERAAAEARREEQIMRDKLLAEKDAAIGRLDSRVNTLMEENERLHRQIEDMYRNRMGSNDDRTA